MGHRFTAGGGIREQGYHRIGACDLTLNFLRPIHADGQMAIDKYVVTVRH
jgi:hypothetical protein